MNDNPAKLLSAALVPGNRAYDQLTEPKRAKLVRMATLFLPGHRLQQTALFAAAATPGKPVKAASQTTTLKRAQADLQAFSKQARLLLRLELAADGSAALLASAEPSPMEKMAAASLPLDTTNAVDRKSVV